MNCHSRPDAPTLQSERSVLQRRSAAVGRNPWYFRALFVTDHRSPITAFLRLGLSVILMLPHIIPATLGVWLLFALPLATYHLPLAYGAIPQMFNYQGRLTDAQNNPRNGTFTMTFRIYDTATSGNLLWNETQTVTVVNGVFNVKVGAGTVIPVNTFDGSTRYLEIVVDDGTNPAETMSPRQQLLSAPYTFTTDRFSGWTTDYFVSTAAVNQTIAGNKVFTGNIGIGSTSPGQRLDVLGGNIRSDGGILVSSITLTGLTAEPTLSAGSLIYNSSEGVLKFRTPANTWATVSTATVSGDTALDVSGSTQTKTGGLNVMGSIGLGTTSPASKFDVLNGSITVRGTNSAIVIANTNANAAALPPSLDIGGAWIRLGDAQGGLRTFSNGMGIKFYDGDTSHASIRYVPSASAARLDFGNSSTSGDSLALNTLTMSLDVTTNGNVGIGTAVMSSKFDVFNGSITVRGTNAGMVIASGNVGIGSISPGQRLDVLGGNIRADGGILGSSITLTGLTAEPTLSAGSLIYNSSTGLLRFRTPANTWATVSTATVAGDTALDVSGSTQTKTGGLNVMGSIGLGTTSPSSKFDVLDGSITVRGTNAGMVIASGNVGIGSISPTQKLDVFGGNIQANGGILVSSITLTGLTAEPTLSAGSLIYNSSTGLLRFRTPASTWVTVSTATVAGDTALDVSGSTQTKTGGLILGGDLNTGSNLVAGGLLKISGSGSHYISAGNVGIGTTSPSYKFEIVDGSMTVRGTNATLNISSSTYLATAIGSVGIGTTVPAHKLDVVGGNIRADGGILGSSITLTGLTAEPTLSAGSLIYNSSTGLLRFRTPAGTWATVSTATVAGDTALDVSGSTQTKTGGLILGGDLNTGSNLVAGGLLKISGSGSHYISAGNVGIGTTSPSYKFEVVDGSITVRGTNATLNVSSSTYLATTIGSVGIGTTVPAHKLDVVGGNIQADGGVLASSITLSGLTAEPTLSAGSLIYNSSTGLLRFRTPANAWATVSTATVAGGTALDVSASTQTKTGGLILGGDLNTGGNLVAGKLLKVSGRGSHYISDGNLGIGTTIPGNSLHISTTAVAVKIRIQENNTSYGNVINFLSGVSNNGYIGQDGLNMANVVQDAMIMATWYSKPLIFFTNQAERIRVTELGLIGIGTTSPTAKFDVFNGSVTVRGTNAMMLVDGNVGFGTTRPSSKFEVVAGSITIRGTDTGSLNIANIGIGGTARAFDVFNGTFSVLQNGNVGIGTGSPSTSLDVLGTVGISGNIGIGTTDPSSKFEVVNGSITVRGTDAGMVIATGNVGIGTTSPSSKFDVLNGSITVRGTNAGMVIATGNVGIGTTNPSSKFAVVDGSVTIKGTDVGSLNIVNIGIGGTARAFDVFNGTFTVLQNGSVGVGSSSPSSMFDVVNGSITVRGTNAGLAIRDIGTTGSAANAYIDATTGALLRSTSSKRYKDNITVLNTKFDEILNVQPKKFRDKAMCGDDPNCNRMEIGFIAEDLDEHPELRDLVVYDAEGQVDAIKYDRIPLYLVEVIKELKAQKDEEIAELKARIQALEKKIKNE